MKFTVFQSEKGDCLLLESDAGTRILCDGGLGTSYSRHVAPALGKLAAGKKKLDLVYLSHIDDDHIGGILQLMNDVAAWRIYDYQTKSGNRKFKKPEVPRPPEIDAIWHNAFHEEIGENAGDVASLLAASAAMLAASTSPALIAAAAEQQTIALGQAQATSLARRVGANQLNIPLNPPAKGKLMFLRKKTPVIPLGAQGDLQVHVIGPTQAYLEKLRDEWNKWLKDKKAALEKIQARAAKDEQLFGNARSDILANLEARAVEYGKMSKVTTPNLASLMLFIEEPGAKGRIRKYLMTGDGHSQHVLEGLAYHKKLDAAGAIHVDVLKFPHHASEYNANDDFCRRVTADHYIFCGNGEHENPDYRILEMVLESRLGTPAQMSANAQAGKPFKFWFSSSPTFGDRKSVV